MSTNRPRKNKTQPQRPIRPIQDFKDEINALMPEDSHWLVDEIMDAEGIFNKDDHDFYICIEEVLLMRPQLRDLSIISPMLEPIMGNPKVDEDLKEAVKRAQEILERSIKVFLEDYPDGYLL